jgi:ADP-heptose:LPS heptosyltransferase
LRNGQPRVVILRALKLGDFLTAVPSLRALTDFFPDHLKVLAAPSSLSPLVAHTSTAGVVAGTPGLVPLPQWLDRPDVAVDLHGFGPESQRLLTALRPCRFVAFRHPAVPQSEGGPSWDLEEHEVDRWCRLLTESGIPADPRRIGIQAPICARFRWTAGATIIHPGAASGARRWPPERFAAVARAETAEGRTVVVTGNRSERSLACRVARMAGLPGRAVIAGRTRLLELLSVVASAERVICGDTGIAHVATALGTPSVVLFGPVPPSRWGPPPHRPQHIPLWAGIAGDPHGRRPDPGLLEIQPADVLAAIRRLPARSGPLGEALLRAAPAPAYDDPEQQQREDPARYVRR